jgi:hypothetical protein
MIKTIKNPQPVSVPTKKKNRNKQKRRKNYVLTDGI